MLVPEEYRAELHPTANIGIVSDEWEVKYGSRITWICKNEHTWEGLIEKRSKNGCPYCSGRVPVIGINDLATTHPEIIPLFDLNKNTVSLTVLSAGSGIKTWWKCEKGHEWQLPVREQLKRKIDASHTGCLYCDDVSFLYGFNDITLTHPSIASTWDYTKNNVNIENTYHKFSDTYWWICNKGHSYPDTILNRKKGRLCDVCAGTILLSGINDTATLHPQLVKFWDSKINKKTLNTVLPNDRTVYDWTCDKNHAYTATISRILKRSSPCVYCSNQELLIGFNDFNTVEPELASEWHPTLNGGLKPTDILPRSGLRIWWQDSLGHEWQATPQVRASQRTGCPYCSKRKALRSFNDLQHLRPEIAAEWHPTLNGSKTPFEVTVQSPYRATWICDKGHVWEAPVYNRTGSNNTGCAQCSIGNSSKAESFLEDFLKLNGVKVVPNTKKILPSQKEIDLYLPDYKIGIEFNGIYWHTEDKGKDSKYHYNKWLEAKNIGIQLIQIWEDDYIANPELIKKMLLHKIGINTDKKVYGKQTKIVLATKKEAQEFLNINHIQGWAAGSIYLALQTKDNDIVALMVFKKESDNNYILSRYATSLTVVGGFTKLLKYFINKYQPDLITTFADHTISNGGLYDNNGFIADKEIPPDYMYVIAGKRYHKFSFRLKRFRNDPKLKYEENLSEKQLADLNNIYRIWDAGKTRYVLNNILE